MKFKLSFLFFFISLSSLVYAQDWKNIILSPNSSIDFPEKPNKVEMQGFTIFKVQNTNGIFITSFRNYNGYNTSGFKGEEGEKFLADFITSTINAQKGEVLTQSKFKIGKVNGLKTKYVTDKKLMAKYNQVYLYEDYLIVTEYWCPLEEEKEYLKYKDQFLNSFAINN